MRRQTSAAVPALLLDEGEHLPRDERAGF
jgi:hypothetical protein